METGFYTYTVIRRFREDCAPSKLPNQKIYRNNCYIVTLMVYMEYLYLDLCDLGDFCRLQGVTGDCNSGVTISESVTKSVTFYFRLLHHCYTLVTAFFGGCR